MCYVKMGKKSEAVAAFTEAISIWKTAAPSGRPHLARAYANLAAVHRSQKRYSEAESLLLNAIDINVRLGLENHPDHAMLLQAYGLVLRKTNRRNEAKSLAKRARALRERHAEENLLRHTVDLSELLATRNRQR